MIQILQQTLTIVTSILMSMQSAIAEVPANTQMAQVLQVASLSVSPSSSSTLINNTFTVNILLNAAGQPAYGVDVNYLRFNPSILQVVDSDSGAAGVQIAPGSLMSFTVVNSVDNSSGTIQFSQLANPGTTFSGSGILATITFRTVAAGTSNVTFDFVLGSGTDSNVAALGGDMLGSVTNGSYTVTAPDTTSPSAPANLSATVVSSSQINLSWTASTDNVGVSGYRLERCSGSSTCSNYLQVATPSSTSYSDTALTAGTIYRYRVRAIDAAGNLSSYSSAVNSTTLPPADTTSPAISSIAISSVTTSGATISWTTNESSDTQVDYGLTSSFGSQNTLNSSMVTSHSSSLSGLSPATTYYFRARSRDSAGNLGLSSSGQFTTQSLPDVVPPSVPAGLTAVSTSQTQIQVSWNASIDSAGTGQSVSGIKEYKVFRGGSLVATTASTAYLDTGLSQGNTYSYQVTAVDNAGNSSIKSIAVNLTIPILSLSVQRKVAITPEGAPTAQKNLSGTIEFIDPSSGIKVHQASFTTDFSGQYTVDVPAGLPSLVTLRAVVPGYLSKRVSSVDLVDASVLNVNFPVLPAGDFNTDGLINSLDFSYMNSKWSGTDSLSDINSDNIVNSLDFAYLSNNWLLAGE